MDTIIVEKYKTLLKKCLEKGISLDIIQQITLTINLPNKSKIVKTLMKIIDTVPEQQLKKTIAQLIEEN